MNHAKVSPVDFDVSKYWRPVLSTEKPVYTDIGFDYRDDDLYRTNQTFQKNRKMVHIMLKKISKQPSPGFDFRVAFLQDRFAPKAKEAR